MADLLRSDRDLAPSFLNSVLNQLNWAFSEFIGMIQEVGVHQGCGMRHSMGAVSCMQQGSRHNSLGWGSWLSFWEGAPF